MDGLHLSKPRAREESRGVHANSVPISRNKSVLSPNLSPHHIHDRWAGENTHGAPPSAGPCLADGMAPHCPAITSPHLPDFWFMCKARTEWAPRDQRAGSPPPRSNSHSAVGDASVTRCRGPSNLFHGHICRQSPGHGVHPLQRKAGSLSFTAGQEGWDRSGCGGRPLPWAHRKQGTVLSTQ